MIKRIGVLLMLFVSGIPAVAQGPACTQNDTEPLVVSRAWWQAFATGEIGTLEERTASQFSWTSSTGSTLDRLGTLARAAGHDLTVVFEWKEGAVRAVSSSVAIVTNRLTETVRSAPPVTYRYLSVLECSEGRWRVAAAQSTRELELSIRVPDANRALDDFVGAYRAPSGLLQITTDGGALILTDPTGRRTRFESIGTDVFELSEVTGAGIIRFAFHRGLKGDVVSMTRIASTVTTFPRIELARELKTKE
jgi:hypothetical protein